MAGAASSGLGVDNSYSISEDLSAKQFHLVKPGTIGKALLHDTAGGYTLGTIQQTGMDGSTDVINARIRTGGESLCKVGGTIAVGDQLQADTDGMAIVAQTGDHVFARALEIGADLDIIRIDINQEGIKA